MFFEPCHDLADCLRGCFGPEELEVDSVDEFQFMKTRQRNGFIVFLQPFGNIPRIFFFDIQFYDYTRIYVNHLKPILSALNNDLTNKFSF